MPALDLKIVAHHGTIARQRIAGREELAGRPIIEVHRLLKNEVEATLGLSAYALYSDACIEAMGLADPAAAGLIAHRETYEHLGEITVWVRDLARGVGRRSRDGPASSSRRRTRSLPTRRSFPRLRRSPGTTRPRRPADRNGSTGCSAWTR